MDNEKMMNEIIQKIGKGESIASLSETYSIPKKAIKVWLNKYRNKRFLKAKKLINRREYDKSLEILSDDLLKDDEQSQSLKVKTLLNLERIEEALEICEQEVFQDNVTLQSQRINILLSQEKEEEALEICNRDVFATCENIQLLKVKILLKRGAEAEVLRICNQKDFKNKFFRKILLQLQNPKNDFIDTELYTLASKLYYNNLSLDDILTSNLDQWMQTIFLFAYFEKTKSRNGVTYMKKWKCNLELKEDQKEIWNQCMVRLQNKRAIYLQETYDLLIFGIENVRYKEEKQEVLTEPKIEPVKTEKLKKENVPVITEKEITLKSKTAINISENIPPVPKKVKKIKNEKTSKTVTLETEFYNKIIELKKYIYVKMFDEDVTVRQNAILAWDILENMTSKSVRDFESLERLKGLLNRTEDKMLIRRK